MARQSVRAALGPRAVPRRVEVERGFGGPSLAPAAPVDAGPYVDYSRSLTREGGILIVFKDLDPRWRHRIWRVLAWTTASGLEARYIHDASPVVGGWINVLCWLAVAGINLWIVWRAVEVYRRIEVRPDCLIIESGEVFWRERMEDGWPELQPTEEDGVMKLRGIYGTRLVEFLTVRKFDECDSTPEVFAAHLAQAFQQLWDKPQRTGGRVSGNGPRRSPARPPAGP